ncbi:MAG: DMT family transporter [Rhodospirillaceae bacterium]|nr:DMT family transporter [Rhodospirillaceae bacterium]
MAAREWFLLIVLSLIWGGPFFFAEIALRDLGPLSIVGGRVTLAALALLVYVYMSGKRMPSDVGSWGQFFVMGGLNNMIPFSLIVWGQSYIDSGLASVLNATTPLFTVALAHLLTADEKLNINKAVGILFGIIGVSVLIGPDALDNMDGQAWGKIAILGAAICYSFAGIFGRRLSRHPPSVAATGMLMASSVIMLPVALIVESPLEANPDMATWGSLLTMALLSTSVAYLIYFHILAKAGATNLLLVTFLVPVSALLLGILILGERLTGNAIIGMILIFSGLACVDGRVFRLFRRRSTS